MCRIFILFLYDKVDGSEKNTKGRQVDRCLEFRFLTSREGKQESSSVPQDEEREIREDTVTVNS